MIKITMNKKSYTSPLPIGRQAGLLEPFYGLLDRQVK